MTGKHNLGTNDYYKCRRCTEFHNPINFTEAQVRKIMEQVYYYKREQVHMAYKQFSWKTNYLQIFEEIHVLWWCNENEVKDKIIGRTKIGICRKL